MLPFFVVVTVAVNVIAVVVVVAAAAAATAAIATLLHILILQATMSLYKYRLVYLQCELDSCNVCSTTMKSEHILFLRFWRMQNKRRETNAGDDTYCKDITMPYSVKWCDTQNSLWYLYSACFFFFIIHSLLCMHQHKSCFGGGCSWDRCACDRRGKCAHNTQIFKINREM